VISGQWSVRCMSVAFNLDLLNPELWKPRTLVRGISAREDLEL